MGDLPWERQNITNYTNPSEGCHTSVPSSPHQSGLSSGLFQFQSFDLRNLAKNFHGSWAGDSLKNLTNGCPTQWSKTMYLLYFLTFPLKKRAIFGMYSLKNQVPFDSSRYNRDTRHLTNSLNQLTDEE